MSRATRKQFIDHSIVYLRQWGFDGLDLDWEYPCQRGGKPSDKQGYVDLVAVSNTHSSDVVNLVTSRDTSIQ